MGCAASIFSRRASAGGQLEHPSDVNSSTRTGCDCALGVCAGAALSSPCRPGPAAGLAAGTKSRLANRKADPNPAAIALLDITLVFLRTVAEAISTSLELMLTTPLGLQGLVVGPDFLATFQRPFKEIGSRGIGPHPTLPHQKPVDLSR